MGGTYWVKKTLSHWQIKGSTVRCFCPTFFFSVLLDGRHAIVTLHLKLCLTVLSTWSGCWSVRHSKSFCIYVLFFYAWFRDTGFILQTSCLATVLRVLEISHKLSHQMPSSRWGCKRIVFWTLVSLSWWADSFLLLWRRSSFAWILSYFP